MTEYPYEGRTVRYAVERKKGNEAVYDWVRQNPHKLNLGRIGLVMDGESVDKGRLSDVRQELDLYEGILNSRFCLDGMECQVRTACGGGYSGFFGSVGGFGEGAGSGALLSLRKPGYFRQ